MHYQYIELCEGLTPQGGHAGQGKVREILFFFKVRKFYKVVREILNTKKVREKIPIILSQNCSAVAGIYPF